MAGAVPRHESKRKRRNKRKKKRMKRIQMKSNMKLRADGGLRGKTWINRSAMLKVGR